MRQTILTHLETVEGEASVRSSVSKISLTYSDRYSLSPFNKFRYWNNKRHGDKITNITTLKVHNFRQKTTSFNVLAAIKHSALAFNNNPPVLYDFANWPHAQRDAWNPFFGKHVINSKGEIKKNDCKINGCLKWSQIVLHNWKKNEWQTFQQSFYPFPLHLVPLRRNEQGVEGRRGNKLLMRYCEWKG